MLFYMKRIKLMDLLNHNRNFLLLRFVNIIF